jgi:hypothetical protein
MWKLIKDLDQVLRGEATRPEALEEAKLQIPLGGLTIVILVLAVVYGICMGFYALFRPDGPMLRQWLATTIKLPALFFLTLLVTFPSLYVFNALIGSRLSLSTVLRLLVASLAINTAVLASLGPIVAFFSVSSESYSFMVLLNVAMFSVSGLLGLLFLLQTLDRIDRTLKRTSSPSGDLPATGSDAGQSPEYIRAEVVETPGALDRLDDHVLGKHVKAVFTCWIVVFGFVGAQMGWVLRPFIGAPGSPFQIFRPRGSNFFEAVFHTIRTFFS